MLQIKFFTPVIYYIMSVETFTIFQNIYSYLGFSQSYTAEENKLRKLK